jgi:L-ascorbate metabolism protein UlaG (beta-lactamase superfamily)
MLAFLALLLLGGCTRQKAEVPPVEAQQRGVTVIYHGHACFTVKGSDGFTIVLDPFEKGIGYPVPAWIADVALATHKHFDHDKVAAVKAAHPPHIEEFGDFTVGPVHFRGVKAPHWTKPEFESRGYIAIYCWEQDGVKLCHLGDLGQPLTPDQIAQIKPVDVLFLPVGGNYTIGPKEDVEVLKQLDPQVVVPMHYKTSYTDASLKLGTVGDFLGAIPKDWDVRREAGNFAFFGPEVFNKLKSRPTVWVINP